MTVQDWLTSRAQQLNQSNTPDLDARLLLQHTLSVNSAWLVAHNDEELTIETVAQADALITRRMNHEPIAYLTGQKEFYGRNFTVSPDVLIPRPESEAIIDQLLALQGDTLQKLRLVDVGSGSGCLGITSKLELPLLDVTLSDLSSAALRVAQKNATQLGAAVSVKQSDLLSAFAPNQRFDIIIANLPYVDTTWPTSPELKHEPSLALYADDGGLASIKTLLPQTKHHLENTGWLLLEADPCQHETIINVAADFALHQVSTQEYCLVLRKN